MDDEQIFKQYRKGKIPSDYKPGLWKKLFASYYPYSSLIHS